MCHSSSSSGAEWRELSEVVSPRSTLTHFYKIPIPHPKNVFPNVFIHLSAVQLQIIARSTPSHNVHGQIVRKFFTFPFNEF